MKSSTSALCYRLEPSKRLLTDNPCPSTCPEHYQMDSDGLPPCLLSDQKHSIVELEKTRRVALMVTPEPKGEFIDQAWEALSTIRAILKQQAEPMAVTVQTIFLAHEEDEARCRRFFRAYYGANMPVTNYVVQPPCDGAALAIEAWAMGTEAAEIQYHHAYVVSVAYDGLRWIHCAGIKPPPGSSISYIQAAANFRQMEDCLEDLGSSFDDVVRTWIYQGDITEPEHGIERYRELNRARTDFYEGLNFGAHLNVQKNGSGFYPASTGIGTGGHGLVTSCLALQTSRDDVRLYPLENPQQTPSCQYDERFSKKSPKFARAMAVAIGDYLTTWISGTASIVNSESQHLGDATRQTEQTIDNIEALINPQNLERHGLSGAGSQLSDLAKVRVYVKRREDYAQCRSVCEQRLGDVPVIYALADVCRPDLLVEIEGVAFSRIGS